MVRPSAPTVAIALLSLALLALLFGFRDLPMVDLPHHSALLTLWLSFADPFQGDQHFEPNFRTPYLLTYLIARSIAPLTGPVGAFKLLVWGAVVGNAFAHAALARRLGHSPWLGLVGLLTGLGHAFYFGFISFLVTTPLVIFSWVMTFAHRENPRWKSGLQLAALLMVVLVSHGIGFTIAAMVAGCLLLTGAGTWWQRLAPFTGPGLLALTWFIPGKTTEPIGGSDWTVHWSQGLDFPASLISMYSSDRLAWVFGVLILMVVAVHLGQLQRRWEFVLPLLITAGGYALFPPRLWGLDWLNARFTGFVIPTLLIAFQPALIAPAARRLKAVLQSPQCLVALVTTWFCVFGSRLYGFNQDTASFHRLIAQIPPDLNVRSLVFERESPSFPSVPALIHLPVYYQVEKGGFHGFSFAIYPSSVIRFREPRVLPHIAGGMEWHPEWFDAPSEVPQYDYFIVHSAIDRSSQLFSQSPEPVSLDTHVGSWWGYRRSAATLQRDKF
jgi:hypothetical protein